MTRSVSSGFDMQNSSLAQTGKNWARSTSSRSICPRQHSLNQTQVQELLGTCQVSSSPLKNALCKGQWPILPVLQRPHPFRNGHPGLPAHDDGVPLAAVAGRHPNQKYFSAQETILLRIAYLSKPTWLESSPKVLIKPLGR